MLQKVPDYDDESGVYLGPGRNFDDEDLEYLNKDVEEQHYTAEKEESPPSPLIVDSVSGIYLGFDDKEESEEDEAPETAETGDDLSTSSETEEAAKDTSNTSKLSWKLFKVKQSSNYKVNGGEGAKADGSNCFKFIRKVWRKAEVCQ